MYYSVVVGYESEGEKGVKVEKTKYIVEAESVEEATVLTAKYAEGDARTFEVVSVTKFPMDCVIDRKNTPEYYKPLR